MSSETDIRPALKGFKDFRSEAVVTSKQIVRDIEIPLSSSNVQCTEFRVLPKAYNEILSECSELDSGNSGSGYFKKSVCEKVPLQNRREQQVTSKNRSLHQSSEKRNEVPPKGMKRDVIPRKPLSSCQSLRSKPEPKPAAKTSRSASDGKVFQNLINLTFKEEQRGIKEPSRKPRPVAVTKRDPEPVLSDYCSPTFNTEYVVKFPPVRPPILKELPAAEPYAILNLLSSLE